MKILTLISFILLFTVVAHGQQKSPYNWQFKESSAEYLTAASLDCISTGKLSESNPLLRGANGRISQPKCFAVNLGGYALTVALQKRWPNQMNWVRRFGAGFHFGVAIRNWNQN